MIKLQIIGNVLEGFVELGSIMGPCIIKSIVLDLFYLPLELSLLIPLIPAMAGATIVATSLSLASFGLPLSQRCVDPRLNFVPHG
jgi:hypothetical protein